MQRIRHIVHLIIAFFADYICLFWKPLFYELQFQHFRNEFPKVKQQHKLCILGSGPSFKQIVKHVSEMPDYDFCTVNASINTDDFWKIKPTMFVMVDSVFYKRKDKDYVNQVWENIQRISWDIKICIPFNFPIGMKKAFEKNPHVRVCRFANNAWDPEHKHAKQLKFWLYKKGLISPDMTNVSLGAIYSAIQAGYKDISLLGVEHSWISSIRVNDKNELEWVRQYYYGEIHDVMRDPDGSPTSMVDFLSSQRTTFLGHMNLNEFAKYINIKITNRTKSSFIDSYPRGDVNEMFKS